MKLGTLRIASGTVAVRIDSELAVEIEGVVHVGELLQDKDWRIKAEKANGEAHALSEIEQKQWAPVNPAPSKILCVGLNYENHIREMGREIPTYPTLFTKYPEALIGPFDDLELPKVAAEYVDWETELAVVIGKKASHVKESDAEDYIAGYAIMNDVSMRDFQNRTSEWLQGKTFENSAPFGPYLVTADSFSYGGEVLTKVNGEVVQSSPLSDQVFRPAKLIEYITQILPLNPGDVIITGTPGGVGHARNPAVYLRAGQVLTSFIEGIGHLENRVVGQN